MTKPSKSSKSPPKKALSASSEGLVPFPYIAIRGGEVRPALPVIVHAARRTITVRGLVDSGADYSVMPQSLAAILGVKLGQCKEVRCETAGGSGVVRVHPIPLEAEIEKLGVRFAMTAAFSPHTTTVLLGRDDFFKAFRVVVDHRAETFSLEPY